jgi:hypothetical protein
MRFGVGGGRGLSELTTAPEDDDANGSPPIFEEPSLGRDGCSTVIDLMKVT